MTAMTGEAAEATPPKPVPDGDAGPPPMTPAIPDEAVESSLRHSIKDGSAWSVMNGAGERYLQPFVILGDQSLLRLAAIAALPGIVGAIIQCFAAEVADKFRRRKRMFVGAALLQALTWIPVCTAIFLPVQTGYWIMLASYGLYIALHSFGLPAWNSVMGDLVPAHRRGRYFGFRNAVTGLALIAAFQGAGAWLSFCQDSPRLALLGLTSRNFGFLGLFALACAARFVSAWHLSRMCEPEYRPQPADHFTLLDFIRRAPRAQFGRFVFYCMLVQVGGGFVGPYLSWHMLDEMQLSPVVFATLWAINLLALYGVQPLWGRLSDRVGTKRVLTIGGLATVLIPVLLLVAANNVWLLGAALVYDGVAWAAFNLAAANYLYDIVTPAKRARCTAFYNLFYSTGLGLGILAGAFVAALVPLPLVIGRIRIEHTFPLLLILSAIFRLLPNVLLLGSFGEYRLRPPLSGPACKAEPTA